MSQLKQKPDDYINVTIELDDMDITSAETKATYDETKKYVAEHNAGMKVSNLYISQVKRKCGIEVGKNYNLSKPGRAGICMWKRKFRTFCARDGTAVYENWAEN